MHTHPKGGSRRDPEVRHMKLREILSRLKAICPKTVADEVRPLVADLNYEHTVYPALTGRWKDILGNIADNAALDKAVGVTFYNANARAIDDLRQALKKKYSMVGSVDYDQWRTVFVCGKNADDTEPIIICANWYPESRESVKTTYRNANSSNASDTNDAEEDDNMGNNMGEEEGDPFA